MNTHTPGFRVGIICIASPSFDILSVGVTMVRERPHVVRTADDTPVTETIAFAVATARNVCPLDLETPLYEVIDADALDSLLSGTDRDSNLRTVQVEFTWAGCDIVVHGTGRVVVTPTAPETGESRVVAT